MRISEYLDQVRAKYVSGQATEHSYRPALQALFESIDPALTVINEPKKSDAGMPDFLFERGGVPLGWAEAKDIDKDVIKLKGYSIEQRKRYEKAYPNLIYTNGVDFEFIREGSQVHFVSIADFLMGLQPKPDRFEELERQLRSFAEQKPISINSAAKLAEMMAAKAAIIKDEIGIALGEDPHFRSGLGGQFKSFKANLLPALTPDEFADIYAETITYGMFAARFHDDDLTTFSRQEALENLPASNPFLKGLFEYIAGPSLPPRLRYIVDDLVQVMRASDPHSLFRDFGKFTARNDPFVHFYEDFLAAYNPKKRKSRGVWYTPEPVVDFIVRAVDDVLKTEFGLADGLADTSKVTVDWDSGTNDPKTGKPVTTKREVHKVQILDPATGTGTFLAKAVQLISDRVKARAPGKWSGYVEADLLPRLHGFELLMASYAMCHMKLDMMLTETGYRPSAKPPRLSVWLTNALEPAEREVKDLFFQPLADEARGASEVKRQTPIMCVIGNPPYSGESANKGAHIMRLMEAYKKEPGGTEKLKERNPKWINDDYVKFIRMSEDLIARNPSGGVLGFITNHGYLDNPTFRGMRWHLLKTFDKIWMLDLHGNAKKMELSPDGTPDKNVFDIQQGVALIIAARKGSGNGNLAEVWHGDLWGSRNAKNEALWAGRPSNCIEIATAPKAPAYPLVPREDVLADAFSRGFSIVDLLPLNGVGIITKRDKLSIHMDKSATLQAAKDILTLPQSEFYNKYSLPEDVRDWRYDWAIEDIKKSGPDENLIKPIYYRLFDRRFIYFTGRARGFVGWPTTRVMRHMYEGSNIGICYNRTIEQDRDFADVFVVDGMIQHHTTSIKEVNYLAPLYRYSDEDAAQGDALASTRRTPNLDPKLYAAICAAAGIDPADQAAPPPSAEVADGPPPRAGEELADASADGPPPRAGEELADASADGPPPRAGEELADFRAATGEARPSEVKLFDYIYGVLHSPAYRETFAEFLKIDFPRIPYPPSPQVFRHVSEKGEQLRRLHLMEASAIGETPYPYHGEGDDVVAGGYPKFEKSSPARGGGPQSGGGASRHAATSVVATPLHHPSDGPPPRAGEELADASADGPPPRAGEDERARHAPGMAADVRGRSAAVHGRVHINPHQYFADVPAIAWGFHIGGYQPAQKWLKDRRGRALSWDDIGHYQKIVKILVETDRIMREIEPFRSTARRRIRVGPG